jgi:hypothetical protein
MLSIIFQGLVQIIWEQWLTAFLAVLETSQTEALTTTIVKALLNSHGRVVQGGGPFKGPLTVITIVLNTKERQKIVRSHLSTYRERGKGQRSGISIYSPPARVAIDTPIAITSNVRRRITQQNSLPVALARRHERGTLRLGGRRQEGDGSPNQ